MNQKHLFTMLALALILSLVMPSCGPAETIKPEPPAAVQAQPTAAEAAPVENTAPPPLTPTPVPTDTPAPTPTPAPTDTPAPTATPEPAKGVSYGDPQKYTVTYQVTIKNTGFNPTDIRLYLPVPAAWDAQQDLEIVKVDPAPKSQGADPKSGNATAYWQLKGAPKKNENAAFTLQFNLTAYETTSYIDPAQVQPYDTGTGDYKKYTAPEKFIESGDAKIKALADEIGGDETNPYLLAQKFYDHIIDTARYKLLYQGLNGAKYLLENGVGECGDYSSLFIALSRAKGIPARPVVGYWARSGNDQTHVWAEFYLEGYGWIPVDATVGQQSAARRAYYFGNMDNQRVILSKGFNSALVPAGPDGFKAPILQVPLWWYWGSGDSKALKLERSWSVSKQ